MKKTSIPETVILGDVGAKTKDDDAIVKEAADTTAKQLADGHSSHPVHQNPQRKQNMRWTKPEDILLCTEDFNPFKLVHRGRI